MSLITLVQHSPRGDAAPVPRVPAADRAPRRPSRRDLVRRVIAFLRDNTGEPVTVAELSRMAGVSERTLRTAFHDVLGLSPKRYVIAQRLRAARKALSTADPHTTTVTDVAMAFGFFELGRFAVRYRHAFGELPSRTLQHVAESWPGQVA